MNCMYLFFERKKGNNKLEVVEVLMNVEFKGFCIINVFYVKEDMVLIGLDYIVWLSV